MTFWWRENIWCRHKPWLPGVHGYSAWNDKCDSFKIQVAFCYLLLFKLSSLRVGLLLNGLCLKRLRQQQFDWSRNSIQAHLWESSRQGGKVSFVGASFWPDCLLLQVRQSLSLSLISLTYLVLSSLTEGRTITIRTICPPWLCATITLTQLCVCTSAHFAQQNKRSFPSSFNSNPVQALTLTPSLNPQSSD